MQSRHVAVSENRLVGTAIQGSERESILLQVSCRGEDYRKLSISAHNTALAEAAKARSETQGVDE